MFMSVVECLGDLETKLSSFVRGQRLLAEPLLKVRTLYIVNDNERIAASLADFMYGYDIGVPKLPVNGV